MAQTTPDLWPQFSTHIEARLDAEDDPHLWQFALNTILSEWALETAAYAGKDCVIAEIGRCSHWIRPHWKHRSGLSCPYGYSNVGQRFALGSLPGFDWSLKWMRDLDANQWRLVSGQPSRRPLVHRIAIPARTIRHPQATVHTIWTPGSPNDPKHKLTIVYGFEESEGSWRRFTSREHLHGSKGPKSRI